MTRSDQRIGKRLIPSRKSEGIGNNCMTATCSDQRIGLLFTPENLPRRARLCYPAARAYECPEVTGTRKTTMAKPERRNGEAVTGNISYTGDTRLARERREKAMIGKRWVAGDGTTLRAVRYESGDTDLVRATIVRSWCMVGR